MKKLSVIAIVLLLSACGGSSKTETVSTPPPVPVDPTPVLDTFFTRVAALVGTSAEDVESDSVDSIVGNEPENTEPVPI